MLGQLFLRQLLPETGELLLSRREVSGLVGKVVVQLG